MTLVERTERLMPWLNPEMTRILDVHVKAARRRHPPRHGLMTYHGYHRTPLTLDEAGTPHVAHAEDDLAVETEPRRAEQPPAGAARTP